MKSVGASSTRRGQGHVLVRTVNADVNDGVRLEVGQPQTSVRDKLPRLETCRSSRRTLLSESAMPVERVAETGGEGDTDR